MKILFATLALAAVLSGCQAASDHDGLVFDPDSFTSGSLTLPTGRKVDYKAYEKLYFVTNVEDSAYQYMNVYVPEGATQETPIFLRTYVGGYMASQASGPQAGDASGRALAEGSPLRSTAGLLRHSTGLQVGRSLRQISRCYREETPGPENTSPAWICRPT